VEAEEDEEDDAEEDDAEEDDAEEDDAEEEGKEALLLSVGMRSMHCWIKPCLQTYSMALVTTAASLCFCKLSTIRRKPFKVDSAHSLSPCLKE
jgi:ABC-type Zn2+ transport system substrate-binding protein/surface adhesin